MSMRSEILNGIKAEMARAAKKLSFRVARREQQGAVWSITVDLGDPNGRSGGGLDESLEGARAWWPGPPKGAADVLSVIPESDQINLRYATATPPQVGETLFIYPIVYLEALRDRWQDASWAAGALRWQADIAAGQNLCDESLALDGELFPFLRARQKEAFRLPCWEYGFLWGPPGTGKTTTLGALLATVLVTQPNDRVLLLSTTNSAVDQALISVDTMLEMWTATYPPAGQLRKRCSRIGNHFLAGNYKGREHLLPVKDDRLLQELVALETKRPDKENVAAYARWREQMDDVRRRIRQQAKDAMEKARLAAMTTTRAAFTLDLLRESAPFDLIVFDEASQVSQAHALALLPLGHRVLFAGDPQQLAPIVTSEHPDALRWIGESMFREMDPAAPSTCLLNEQSRMAEPICKIVSTVFYRGELVVAADKRNDREWIAERALPDRPPLGGAATVLESIAEDGVWSQKYHGPIRFPSAERIRDLVVKLTFDVDETDIIVLTPFRAQRTLIRQFLKNAGIRRVSVSTVHRAQGSERHTVFFDPVLGESPFLLTEDARRLVNVALSRAKARLVLTLSPGDLKNPVLRQVANLIILPAAPPPGAIPIGALVGAANFPENAVDKVVQIGKFTGRVTEVVEGGTYFHFTDFATGATKKFKTEFVVRNNQ